MNEIFNTTGMVKMKLDSGMSPVFSGVRAGLTC
jgi:hypothetical protein